MITTGIIREVAVNKGNFIGNAYKVELNIFQIPGDNDKKNYTYTANCIVPGGVYDSFNVGDKVFVGFLNNNKSLPLILGKIYQGVKDEARSIANLNALKVKSKAELPENTTIGNIDFSDKEYFFDNVNEVIQDKDIFANTITTNSTITGGLEVSGEVTIPSPIASNNPATKKYVDDIIFNLPTTLTISPSNFESQTAKTILAAPSADDGVPTFREIIAEDISYDNSDSGLESQTVKGALDELSADIITSTPEAIDITTDTAQFTTILSSADTNVQHALETLDKHTHALPVASTTVLGAVKIGSGLSITNEVLSVTSPGYTSQAAKTFLAAPTATAGIPTFREIIAADIPKLNQDTTGNAETATKLATAILFTVTDYDGTNSEDASSSFDGSSDYTIKLPSIIKASITGTASGNLTSSSPLSASKLSGRIGLGNLPTGEAGTILKGTGTNSPEWGAVAWDEVTSRPEWIGASKPTYTAADVGALPLTGGTLSGDLEVTGLSNFSGSTAFQNLNINGVISSDSGQISFEMLDIVDFGGAKLESLGTPSESSDAATKEYVDTKVAQSGSYIPLLWDAGADIQSSSIYDLLQLSTQGNGTVSQIGDASVIGDLMNVESDEFPLGTPIVYAARIVMPAQSGYQLNFTNYSGSDNITVDIVGGEYVYVELTINSYTDATRTYNGTTKIELRNKTTGAVVDSYMHASKALMYIEAADLSGASKIIKIRWNCYYKEV